MQKMWFKVMRSYLKSAQCTKSEVMSFESCIEVCEQEEKVGTVEAGLRRPL